MQTFKHNNRGAAFGSSALIRPEQEKEMAEKDVQVRTGQAPVKVEQTSAGLRDLLFKTIEQLRGCDIEANEAKAVAFLSREICNTVKLEIDVARLRTEYPEDAKLIIPTVLQLGPK